MANGAVLNAIAYVMILAVFRSSARNVWASTDFGFLLGVRVFAPNAPLTGRQASFPADPAQRVVGSLF